MCARVRVCWGGGGSFFSVACSLSLLLAGTCVSDCLACEGVSVVVQAATFTHRVRIVCPIQCLSQSNGARCVPCSLGLQAWELLHKGVGYLALALGVLAINSGLQLLTVRGGNCVIWMEPAPAPPTARHLA